MGSPIGGNTIIVASVPHSGTLLITGMFRNLGYEVGTLTDPLSRGKQVRFGHFLSDCAYNTVIDYIKSGIPCVTPIRHPYLVAESWKMRRQPMNELRKVYRLLPKLCEAGANIIPIDSPDRQYYLDKASENIGVKINTDWPIINSIYGTYNMKHTDIDEPSGVGGLAIEMKDFLGTYYD